MKPLFFLLPLVVLAGTSARAELGHVFPPIKPDELAKIQAALPQAKVKPAKPRKLLVFFLTEGFVHGAIPYCNEAIKEMGEKTGAYTADFSEDMGVFTPEKLAPYDAVLFNSTTGLKFTDPAARKALLDFVKNGKGVAGIHAATDNFPTWLEGQQLLGGKFDSHPWGGGDVEAVKIDDPSHPIVAGFGGKGLWVNDEIYQMKAPYDCNDVRELISLDMSKMQNARDPKKIHRTDNDFPICWIKQVDGGGRVFYCSFGHNPSIYWTKPILQTYLNGIQYALGDFPADATPTGKLPTPPQPALAPDKADPLNRPGYKPAPPKPVTINCRVPSFVKMVFAAKLAATNAPVGDPLADGIKTVTAYDYGVDRAKLVAFDDYIRAQSAEHSKIEAAILPLLDKPEISAGAKNWIFRTLVLVASDASVPELKKMANDSTWSHLAVYDLFTLGTPAARTALVESLKTAPAPLRPAIVGAIGRLAITDAVPMLAEMTALDDPAQVTAALDALAAIGTADALAALNKSSVSAPLETTRQWALLRGAFNNLKNHPGDSAGPLAVFASLVKPGTVSSMRVAAADGAIQADPTGAWTLISALLKDDDEKVRLDVAKLTPKLSADAAASLTTALPTLDPAVQVVIVNHFASTPTAATESILKQALASADSSVHLAALAGYGTANLASSVSTLLPYLVKSPEETTVAMAALEKDAEPNAASELKTALAAATGPSKAELLITLSERVDHSATDAAFTATGDADDKVAQAAFQAINRLAKPEDFPRVLGLVPQAKTASEGKNLEKALIYTAIKYPDKDKAADLVIAALNGASADNKATLIGALASIDSPKADAELKKELNAPAVDDRKNVIRALSTTHAPRADRLLLEAAANGKETSEKVLALRGYLDSVKAQNVKGKDLIAAYKTAWPLAVRKEEKDAILASLKNMKNKDADKVLQSFRADAPVKSVAN